MRYQDAIENTQALAKLCMLPGLLAKVWGSHSVSREGVVNANSPLDLYEKDSPSTKYAQTHLHSIFARAEPYFVDDFILEVIEATASQVPEDTRLHPRLFKSREGCLFFDRPVRGMLPRLLHHDPNLPDTEPAPMSGFAWAFDTKGVILVFIYSWAADHSSPDFLHGVYVGNIPLAVAPWSFDNNTLENYISFHNDKIPAGDVQNAERFTLSIRIAVATLLLMDQVLTVVAKTPVDRATRKRAERTGWQFTPTVQVVKLRRAEYVQHGSVDVDWSCRWMVRSHWRTYNRGLGDERTVLIPSYIKGPDDKPLKTPTARVFEVLR